MTMKIQITITEPKPPGPAGFVLPANLGQFWRLRWDDEIPPAYMVRASAYNKNGGTAATRVPVDSEFTKMDKAHQLWRWGMWRIMAPNSWVAEYDAAPSHRKMDTMLVKKYLQFWDSTVAWSNHGHGSDVRLVYIDDFVLNPLNAKGEPNEVMSQQMLAPAGNTVLQIAPTYRDGKGVEYVPCKALRPSELLPWETIRNMPWVLHCCTIQRIEMETNGHHRVNRWDQLTIKDVEENDVPLVLLSNNGIITFPKTMLELIPAGSKVPCPYNPPRPFGKKIWHWN